eukprot:scaffold13.g179.t1
MASARAALALLLAACLLAAGRAQDATDGGNSSTRAPAASALTSAWQTATSTVGGWATSIYCTGARTVSNFNFTPCEDWVVNATCPAGCQDQLDKLPDKCMARLTSGLSGDDLELLSAELEACSNAARARALSVLAPAVIALDMAPLQKGEVDAALEQGRRLGFTFSLPPGTTATTPLVLVLGWWGAEDLQLRKHCEVLNAWGYPTVRAICPRWTVVAPVDSPRRNFASRLLSFLEAVGWEGPEATRPLVLYALGNGGALPAEKLDYLVTRDPAHAHLRNRFAGVIFDSAPAFLTRARTRRMSQFEPVKVRLLVELTAVLGTLVSWLLGRKTAAERFWENMQTLALGRRTLYLYAQDDPLCDAARLERLVAARRAAGADVAARSWAHGRHVHLLDDHPEEYRQQLKEFLQSLAAPAAASLSARGDVCIDRRPVLSQENWRTDAGAQMAPEAAKASAEEDAGQAFANWTCLPGDVLLPIFTQLLLPAEAEGSAVPPARQVARAWASLRAVCRRWREVADQAPVSAGLERGAAHTPAALCWVLGRPTLHALAAQAGEVADPTAAADTGLADALLRAPALARGWACSLRALELHCATGLAVGDLAARLGALRALERLALTGGTWAPRGGAGSAAECDAAALVPLPPVRRLALSYARLRGLAALPPHLCASLRHLELTTHVLVLELPGGLALETLNAAAGTHLQVRDLAALLAAAARLSLRAAFLHLGAPPRPGEQAPPPLAAPGGRALQLDACRAVLRTLAASPARALHLQADMLILAHGWLEPRDRPLRMSVLGHLLHSEFAPDFGEPSAYDLSSANVPLPEALISHLRHDALATSIAWPRRHCSAAAEEVLGDPGFVQRNATCLSEMAFLPLTPALDLRPFTALRRLHLARLADARAQPGAPPPPPLPPALREASLVAGGGGEGGGARVAPALFGPGEWRLERLALTGGFRAAQLGPCVPGVTLEIEELRFALDSRAQPTAVLGSATLQLGPPPARVQPSPALAPDSAGGGGARAAVRRLVLDCASPGESRLELGGGPWLAGVKELELVYADTRGRGTAVVIFSGCAPEPAASPGTERQAVGGAAEAGAAPPHARQAQGSSQGGDVDELLACLEAAAPDLRTLRLRFSTRALLQQRLALERRGGSGGAARAPLAPVLLRALGGGARRARRWRLARAEVADGLLELSADGAEQE